VLQFELGLALSVSIDLWFLQSPIQNGKKGHFGGIWEPFGFFYLETKFTLAVFPHIFLQAGIFLEKNYYFYY
jgi:hypothetical protein